MLYAWGHIFPSFIQKAAQLLIDDIDALNRNALDVEDIKRLANVHLIARP